MIQKIKQNILTIVLVVIIVGMAVFLSFKNNPVQELKTVSKEDAAHTAIDYINKNLLQGGIEAELVGVEEESGVYKFRLKIQGKEYTSYITKDGKILFPEEGINLKKALSSSPKETGESKELTKRDRPDVKLFVMSYCPYGLQAEKMFLPVYNLLKDKADFGIYFVDYLMHGKKEMEENLRQYCIEKEQKDKFINYLTCFVGNGKFEECLDSSGVDQGKLDSCVQETDNDFKISDQFTETGYPPFDIYKDLNQKYGVQGSPTIVINDTVTSISPRSPEKFKEIICQAFNNPPKECQEKLSDSVFSPGFGFADGSDSGGNCGQ